MRMERLLQVVLALSLAGCAPSATSRRGTPVSGPSGPTGPKRVKLAVLKVESDQFPELAKALNNQLRDVQVKGVDDYFISKVTLEVVQLSIECVEQTPACYAAVGKSLSAQRLLLARLAAGPVPKRGKKRERVAPVTVTVIQLDAEAGTAVQQAEKQFKNEQEALQGLTEVVQQAAGQEAVAKPATSPESTGKPQAKVGK